MTSPDTQEATFFTGTIGSWCNRHRRIVIVAWVLLLILAIVIIGAVGTNTDIKGGGTGESGEANEIFEERFGVVRDEGSPTEIVVFSHPTLTVEDQEYRDTVLSLMEELRALRATSSVSKGETTVVSGTRVVADTTTHYDIGAPRDVSPFVAQGETGGDVTFASVVLEGELLDASGAGSIPAAIDEVDLVIEAVAAAQARSPDFTILIGGNASQGKQFDELLQETFSNVSLVSLPVTLIILILALGTLVAAVVPIALAFVGIFFTIGLMALISQAIPLDTIYIQIVLLMGLASGIDYAIFLIARFRNAREAGASSRDSVQTAGHTAGRNIFIAAVTTVLALIGMFLAGVPIFTALGLAAVTVIVVAGIISMTLLPALTGDGLNRLRIPFLYRPVSRRKNPYNPYVAKLVGAVVARPAIFTVLFAAILLAVASPIFTLNGGFNAAKALHDDVEAKAAFLALEDNFTLGLSSPAAVVVDAGKNQNVFAEDIQASVNKLIGLVEQETASPENPDALFGAPIQTEINNAGDTELLRIPINADIGEDKAIDAVKHLRADLIPSAFEGSSSLALVTGATAGNTDFRDHINSRTPIVLAFVVVSAFIILVLMYRSLMIPVIAVVLNALSVATSYGILVMVFQRGYLLEGVLDFEATGIIEVWIPLFVFSIVFGISMDYLTFAIGRFKEFHDRGMSTEEAILEAVRGGFGTIFSAAAIMVGVALVFAFSRVFFLQEFGFALAVAVILDGTVILVILLPACLKLAGESNWYLPSWLNWLPGGGGVPQELPQPAMASVQEHQPRE